MKGPVSPLPREEEVASVVWVEGTSWGWRWSISGAEEEETLLDWDFSEVVWLEGLEGWL